MKAKSGKRLRAFLCSDVLVLTDENAKSLYRMVGPRLDDVYSELTPARLPSQSHSRNWP
jgi:actin cytoskeleton-regulatory complex protein PAN1